MAAVLLPFMFILCLIMETGLYFTNQSALDAGVLKTAEALSSSLAAGNAFAPPTAAALKTAIATNGGGLINTATLAVDVRQLSTLSAGAVAIADGTADWGGSGSILVLRANTALQCLTAATPATMTSTAIIRRSLY